jgi:hypothetical protein
MLAFEFIVCSINFSHRWDYMTRHPMKYLTYAVLAASASAAMLCAAPPMIMEQHTIIRIRTYSAMEASKPISWKEKKGPKCIRMDMLGGAAITQPDSVDLVLKGGQHLRAQLEKGCPAHDFFYSGFYLTPAGDGQVCVKRDMFHARMGGDCTITKFHTLELRK